MGDQQGRAAARLRSLPAWLFFQPVGGSGAAAGSRNVHGGSSCFQSGRGCFLTTSARRFFVDYQSFGLHLQARPGGSIAQVCVWFLEGEVLGQT